LQAERRETQKRDDIEALKVRLESDKIWAGNEVEKLRIKKEQAVALSGIHVEQAVSLLLSSLMSTLWAVTLNWLAGQPYKMTFEPS